MVDILKMFGERGFLLDKEVFGILSGMGDEVEGVIDKLIEGVDVKLITKEVFDGVMGKSEVRSPKSESSSVKLLSEFGFRSRKVEVRDFVQHFRSRFEILRDVLGKKVEDLSSIRRVGRNSGVYNIVAMVGGKRMTKNKNLLIEVEDLTGRSVVLVNKERGELFERAKGLMLDDVVVFRCSGSSDMLFVSDIIFPDVGLGEEKFGEEDSYVAFSGDFHVGSKNFLEENVLKFVDWLNGEVGDERQRVIARKVKYLVLVGDIVDGVGVYAGQDKWLNIKNVEGQYKKVVEILGKIRRDVEIVMCAGQHDAVWVGEPQPIVLERWAKGLYGMKNLKLVPNPSLIDIGGFKILMYHTTNRIFNSVSSRPLRCQTASLSDRFAVRSLRFQTDVVREMLKRGHLAPSHGVMDYVPCEVDPMVISVVPDIIVNGDQHRAEVDSYNNVLMVASSCWQTTTPFEEKIGNVPEPCRVPLFNLKSREIKIVDFSDDEIKWDESDDLVCKLEVDDEDSD